MEENEFWDIINETINEPETALQAEAIKVQLLKCSQFDIIDFERFLRKKLIECDYFNIMAIPKIADGSVSDDSYLYFRCWLIGRGKKPFEDAILDPDSLSNLVDPREYLDFEALLYVATDAYEELTSVEENDSFPRNVCDEEGLSYDGNLFESKGKDWEEKDLPKLLPKILAVYED